MEGVHTNQSYPNMTLTTIYSNIPPQSKPRTLGLKKKPTRVLNTDDNPLCRSRCSQSEGCEGAVVDEAVCRVAVVDVVEVRKLMSRERMRRRRVVVDAREGRRGPRCTRMHWRRRW
uniref:Uncharacterized protein n=1 Tax=Oryza rufipogon TaxID=4529 RepID=A0A0E0N494_ORYRU